MRRALILAGVMLVGLLAVTTTAGAAPRGAVVFNLRADGFAIGGRTTPDGQRIRLVLYRHGEIAYYYVPERLDDGTLRARFGRLGSLDLRFRPGRGEGPLGCGGSGGWQEGTFVGSFVFRGEHDYADIDADRARGWLWGAPTGGCSAAARDRRVAPRDRRTAPARASELAQVAETGVELESRTGNRKPLRVFYAFTRDHAGRMRDVYEAYRVERREGMLIERGVEVFGSTADFEWDLGNGTARLEPPAPFSGRAFYREGADGRPIWTGSLRAPVLGGRPMRLTGGEFKARLTVGSPFE